MDHFNTHTHLTRTAWPLRMGDSQSLQAPHIALHTTPSWWPPSAPHTYLTAIAYDKISLVFAARAAAYQLHFRHRWTTGCQCFMAGISTAAAGIVHTLHCTHTYTAGTILVDLLHTRPMGSHTSNLCLTSNELPSSRTHTHTTHSSATVCLYYI